MQWRPRTSAGADEPAARSSVLAETRSDKGRLNCEIFTTYQRNGLGLEGALWGAQGGTRDDGPTARAFFKPPYYRASYRHATCVSCLAPRPAAACSLNGGYAVSVLAPSRNAWIWSARSTTLPRSFAFSASSRSSNRWLLALCPSSSVVRFRQATSVSWRL